MIGRQRKSFIGSSFIGLGDSIIELSFRSGIPINPPKGMENRQEFNVVMVSS